MNENNKETQMQEASESETYAVDFRGGLDDGVELYSSYGGAVSSLYVAVDVNEFVVPLSLPFLS